MVDRTSHHDRRPTVQRAFVRSLVGAALSLGLLAVSSSALAGCPNPCTMTATTTAIDLPFVCPRVEATSSSCECSIHVVVHNDCPDPLESDVPFENCQNTPGGCAGLSPNDLGIKDFLLDATGPAHETMHLHDATGDHTVALSATVSSFYDGCSACRAAPTRDRQWPLGAILTLAVFALWRGRRARARSRPDEGCSS